MSVDNHLFRNIRKQFLCCVPVKEINCEKILDNINWEQQKQLIDETVGHPLLNKYPLQTKYVIRFLRHMIDTLENQKLEVHDDFYSILCEYQMQTNNASDPYSYKHYLIKSDNKRPAETVILKENNNKIPEGTTGLNVWESALVLSEMALHDPSRFHGKCILELGAGTGLSSIVIGKHCGAKSIKVTDGNDKVIEILVENFANNFVKTDHERKFIHCKNETQIEIVNLDWLSDDESLIKTKLGAIDLIIADDIIFDNTLFRALLTTATSVFKHNPNCEKFILVNAVRNSETEREFLDMLNDFSLEYYLEEMPKPKEFIWKPSDISPIKIYCIYPIKR